MTSHSLPSRRVPPSGMSGSAHHTVPLSAGLGPPLSHTGPDTGPHTVPGTPFRTLLSALAGGLAVGLISAVLTFTVFALTSHGMGLRADDRVVPAGAPSLCIAMLSGLACLAPVLPFGRGLRTARPVALLASTLLIGALAATTAFLCRGLSDLPGTAGSVWSDLEESVPAFVAVTALAWAAANLGFALVTCAEAAKRRTAVSLAVLVLFIALAAGTVALGLTVASAPTTPAAVLSVAGAALSALVFAAVHRVLAHKRTIGQRPVHHQQRRRSRRVGAPARTAAGTVVPTGLFHPGEIEYARLHSQPPFDTDCLILTDLRIMRVRIDCTGSIIQLSQAALWQLGSARADDLRDRATVTVELHVGSSMRLEETAPAAAHEFVDIITEAAAPFRP